MTRPCLYTKCGRPPSVLQVASAQPCPALEGMHLRLLHALCAGTHGDTWQNGPPLEWLAKIARPPTPAQELGGTKLPSLGAISEEAELHLSSNGQSTPQVPSLFLVGYPPSLTPDQPSKPFHAMHHSSRLICL